MKLTRMKLILVGSSLSSVCFAATPAKAGPSIFLNSPTSQLSVQSAPCQIKKSNLDSRLKLEMVIESESANAVEGVKVLADSKILDLESYFSEEEPLESLKCQRIDWSIQSAGRVKKYVFLMASAQGFATNPVKEKEASYIEETAWFSVHLLQNSERGRRLIEITDPLKWKESFYKIDDLNGIEKRGLETDHREWGVTVEEIDMFVPKGSPKKTLRFCRAHKREPFKATEFFLGINPATQTNCYYFNRSIEDPLLYKY